MTWAIRSGGVVLALVAAAAVVRAEGVSRDTKGASRADRVMGAVTVIPTAGGLIAVGGPDLRRLSSSAGRWETLHSVAGDSLYRVAADDAGRLLAAWSKEPAIHFISPADQQHVVLARPPVPGPDVSNFQLSNVAFSANGRDAVVYMTGWVQVRTGGFQGPSWSTSAYNIALDGKSPPRPVFRVDHGYCLHTSRDGAVFAMNKHPGRKCDHGECLVSSVVAYELKGDGAAPRTLLDAGAMSIGRARLVRGNDDRRILLMLDASQPRRIELLRWRFGEVRAQAQTLSSPPRDDMMTLAQTKAGDLLELRRVDGALEIWRHAGAAPQRLAQLRALQRDDDGVHGVGERPDGGLWVHWGDHLGLLASGQPPKSYNLASLLPRKSEWSGDVHVGAPPEQLWVGIDGAGRDYVRVTFAEAERRAQPWPAGVNGEVVGTGAEGAVRYAKDPSTKDRLYATVTLSASPGGLLSIGGASLRRLPPGATRWETLHEVRDDNLYRVVADATGRVLASWEKEPFIHLLVPGQARVTLPKPTLAYVIDGRTYNALHVAELEFSADGRDALVYMTGQVGASARYITVAYLLALDGQSPPRQLFRVDQGLLLHTSRAGALFALPRDARQECTHRTCWPMAGIVAYELAAARATARTLLGGDQVDASSAQVVGGSDDQRVGLVLELVRRDGLRRLNGGRGLLRWKWGEVPVDYRPLDGTTESQPAWRMAIAGDFIELRERYDQIPGTLEIHRVPLGAGLDQVTTLRAREKRPTAYALGERRGGGLWIHWGERVVLLSPGAPARSFDIGGLGQRGWEWAGPSVYVPTPESLWVGLDGRGRQFARVDLADGEHRAESWR